LSNTIHLVRGVVVITVGVGVGVIKLASLALTTSLDLGVVAGELASHNLDGAYELVN
jgi:hypothetical protein